MNGKSRKKILVIDDDSAACETLKASLGPRGCDVFIVPDPGAALEKAKDIVPDLIFISLLLPGTNGLKVSKSLHSEQTLRDIPVLMMISHAGELDPKYTVTIGIVDVLVKPLTSDQVIGKALNILDAGSAGEGISFEEEPSDVFTLDDEEEAETIAFPGEPAFESPQEFSPPPGREDEDLTGKKAGLAAGTSMENQDEDDELQQMLRDEDEKTGEEPPEFEYEDEYDSYKQSEKKTTQKIILLAASLFVIIILGIGIYFLKDSLFPPAQSPAPAGRELASAPEQAVSTQPADTLTPVDAVQAAPEPVPADRVRPPKSAPAPSSPAVKPDTPVKQAPAAYPAKTPGTEAKGPPAQPHKTAKVKPAAATKGGFTVQVGVFENKQNADSLSGRLGKLGYAVTVRTDTGKDRKTLYRVTVGSFDSRAAAVKQSEALLNKEHIKSLVREL